MSKSSVKNVVSSEVLPVVSDGKVTFVLIDKLPVNVLSADEVPPCVVPSVETSVVCTAVSLDL
jgi:hypothetical protein